MLNRQLTHYDREMLLETLRQLADRLDRAPTTRELVEHSLPCQATYTARFGSWEAALAEIGLQPRASKLYEREGLPQLTMYKYRFGSWRRALEAAGLTRAAMGSQRDGHRHPSTQAR